MKLKHFLLSALLLFAGVSGVYAGRKYVGFSSSAYNNAQLQNALNDAQAGDTVYVASGLYLATDSAFLVPENVTLIGGYAKGDAEATTRRYPGQFIPFKSSVVDTTQFTILDGNSYMRTRHTEKHRVITVLKDGVVDGCLIRNGHIRNGNGGGVLLNGGKLYNSIVRGNVAMSKPDTIESLGGGVFIQNGGELINCLVAYNMANDGYGVAAGANGGKMINNTVTANTYSPVFAKIPGGQFHLYAGGTQIYYRKSDWLNGEIPKWGANNQRITLSDFYISRTQTTEGQFAVFCAAIDISPIVDTGFLNTTTLKNLTDPINGGTLENRHKFGTVNPVQQRVVQSITNENYAGLKYDDGVWHPHLDTASVEFPVGYVSWYGALAYSVWLGGSLPTMAQWEFAARREPDGTVNDNLYSGAYGSTAQSSASASDATDTVTWRILDTIAWVAASVSIDTFDNKLNASDRWTTRPHEVARKRPNSMGLYDMTGNMYEWLGDWCDSYQAETFPYSTPPSENPIYNTVKASRAASGGGANVYSRRDIFCLNFRSSEYPYTTSYITTIRPIAAF